MLRCPHVIHAVSVRDFIELFEEYSGEKKYMATLQKIACREEKVLKVDLEDLALKVPTFSLSLFFLEVRVVNIFSPL